MRASSPSPPRHRQERSRSRSRSPEDRRDRSRRNSRSASRSRSRESSRRSSSVEGKKKKKKSKDKKHKKSKRKEDEREKEASPPTEQPPVAAKSDPRRNFFEQLKQQEALKERIGTVHTSGRKPENPTANSGDWECVKEGCGHSNMKRATSCTKCGAMRRITQWR